jgi:hypothetical protein
VIGTVWQYPDADSARKAVSGLMREVNAQSLQRSFHQMTVSEACDHFIQRELTKDNTWRNYSTKRAYKAYLQGWIVPHWGTALLSEVRTMGVESWLRSLKLAKSSCAKIRGLFSVLFNHACRYEFFDRNPIRLVRQGAKRRSTPSVLTPFEIKLLLGGLRLRERVLLLLAASTGFYRLASERAVWFEVGRSSFCPKHHVRDTIYRVRGGRTLQDRSIPEAGARSSNHAANTRRVETNLSLQQSRRLDFCKQAAPWAKADVGPSDSATVHSSRRAASGDPKTIRLAQVPAYLLNSSSECRDRIQSDARIAEALLVALDVGCLHASDLAG